MLVELAGGRASDGRKRILDLVPSKIPFFEIILIYKGDIHARSGIFLGSKDEMDRVEEFYVKMDKGEL